MSERRNRRPDSRTMWDDSERHTRDRHTRDHNRPDRHHHKEHDRDRERDRDRCDRDRKYRSRSRSRSCDRRGARGGRRDRDRDRDRDKGRKEKDDRKGGEKERERERERERRKERGEERIVKKDTMDVDEVEEQAPPTHRLHNNPRRSASPPLPPALPTRSKASPAITTASISIPGKSAASHNSKPAAMSIHLHTSVALKDAPSSSSEEEEEPEIEVDDGDAGALQAMLGFGGFGTTKGAKVAGNNVGGVRKEKKTQYRQYMNRAGGFNRPLSPTRD